MTPAQEAIAKEISATGVTPESLIEFLGKLEVLASAQDFDGVKVLIEATNPLIVSGAARIFAHQIIETLA